MDVSIDGLQIGVSPLSVSLPAGAHQIGLRHPDFDPYTARIEGTPGGIIVFSPDLQPSRAAQRAVLLSEETKISLEIALASKNIGDAKIRGASALGNFLYWGAIGGAFVYLGSMFPQGAITANVFQYEGYGMLGVGALVGILGALQFAVIPSMPAPNEDRLADIQTRLKALDSAP